MKTWKKIVLLVGIMLLAFGLTVLQIAHHRGESFIVMPTWNGSNDVGELSYDQKGYTVCRGGEETFSTKDVSRLNIEWLSGRVKIERYAGSGIVVREKSAVSLSEDQSMRYRLSGGTLWILPCANNVIELPEKELTVFVPKDAVFTDVDVTATSAGTELKQIAVKDSITLVSVSGSIRAEEISCTDLNFGSTSGSQKVFSVEVERDVILASVSGSIEVSGVSCSKLALNSTSGSQSVADASCEQLELQSVSGSQKAEDVDCREVRAGSSSGSVKLSFAGEPKSVEVGTISGSVTLTFPDGTPLDLDFDTVSGGLNGSALEGRHPVRVIVGTTSGSLTIRYSA